MAIIDFFDRGWRINPDGAAYIQGDRSYSFNEVGRLSCRIARALLGSGWFTRHVVVDRWFLHRHQRTATALPV